MNTTTFFSWPEGVHGRVPIHFPSLMSQPSFLLIGLCTPRSLQILLPLPSPALPSGSTVITSEEGFLNLSVTILY